MTKIKYLIYYLFVDEHGKGHLDRCKYLYNLLITRTNIEKEELLLYQGSLDDLEPEISHVEFLIVDSPVITNELIKLFEVSQCRILLSPVFDGELIFDYSFLSKNPPVNKIWKSRQESLIPPLLKQPKQYDLSSRSSERVLVCFSGGGWIPDNALLIINCLFHSNFNITVVSKNVPFIQRLRKKYKEDLGGGIHLQHKIDFDNEIDRFDFFVGGSGLMLDKAILLSKICLSIVPSKFIWKLNIYIRGNMVYHLIDGEPFDCNVLISNFNDREKLIEMKKNIGIFLDGGTNNFSNLFKVLGVKYEYNS